MSGNQPDDRKQSQQPQANAGKDPAGKPQDSGAPHSGAHAAGKGEEVKSRSADPGQSSYGGFKNEDPRHQAQQLDQGANKGGQGGGNPAKKP